MRALDPVDAVAQVARARRKLLLRVHRHRLRPEDLEDCYSQATVELLASARRGARFSSSAHLANALEQRFLSRIHDRRRALSGRSPIQAAVEGSVSLDCVGREQLDVVDVRAELETLVILREEIRRVGSLARELTDDQRLLLACQIGLQMDRADFCERFGWSAEKYRKVAQRARARLRRLLAQDEDAVARVERSSEAPHG